MIIRSMLMECKSYLFGMWHYGLGSLTCLTSYFLLHLISCCNWGEGSYKLAFGDDIVASGGEFGANETITFSTPSSELI